MPAARWLPDLKRGTYRRSKGPNWVLFGTFELMMTPLVEIPRGCSSKFPTLMAVDSRRYLLR